MKTRDVELAKAKRVMRKLGFVPISWEMEIEGHKIWIEEVYSTQPRFEVSSSYTSPRYRTTAADLKKTVQLVVNEERAAKRAPDRRIPKERP